MSWKGIAELTTRDELAQLATGIGVELGVADGTYSETLLAQGNLSLLYSIDRWSDHHDEAEMQRAVERLSRFGERSRIIRSSFAEAVSTFDDGSFDFIYIDGYAHTGQECGETLRQWWAKLKVGGIFAGHDYHELYRPTIDAVDSFMREHSLPFRVTYRDGFPSWVTLKQ